jgi:phage terminase small subunit
VSAAAENPNPRPLNTLQLRFVEELCVDWKKAAAARRAGYSVKTAKQIANRLWQDPRIRAAVATRSAELSVGTAEATAKLSAWARADIAELFTRELVPYTPLVEQPLAQLIEELKDTIKFEQELAIRAEALLKDPKAMKKFRKAVDAEHVSRKLQLMRMEMEFERNPKATKWVPGATVAREQVQLDLAKALASEASGLIKKTTPTRYGTGVELHDAKDAVDKLLKLQGAYAPEKHDLTTNGKELPGTQLYLPDNGRD